MAKQIVKVTRKGQVTIPIEQRRKYRIRQGMRLLLQDSPHGILLTPVIPLEDLAGIDAGRVTVDEMKRKLDRMRSEKFY